jgi:hypothetical protein
LKGTNSAKPPRVADLRVVALQTWGNYESENWC